MAPRGSEQTNPQLRLWLSAAVAILAVLTIGLSSAAADEVEGGGGGGEPPTESGGTETPPGESESPPAETPSDSPGEPESGSGSGSPESSPETPSHPAGGTESSAPTASQPSGSAAAPSGGGGAGHRGSTPRHPSGSGSSGHGTRATGTGPGIHAPDLSSGLGSSVQSLIDETLPTEQLRAIGSVLAVRAGFAPAGDKRAQHRTGKRLGDALGVALLSSAVGLSSGDKHHATGVAAFDPIDPGSKTLYLVLLLVAMAVSLTVIALQIRPAIRTRRW